MKHFKMIGLAALAALALIAIVGAASASATVYCKTTNLTSGCQAAGWAYGSNMLIVAAPEDGENVTLNGFWTDVTCETSLIEAKMTSAGSSSTTVSGPIEELTLEGCACAGGEVGTAHATVLANGSLEAHHISGTSNGTLTGKGTVITLNCTRLGTQCRFGTGSGIELGSITGGHMATEHVDGEVVWSSGSGDEGSFLCGSSAVWEAKYTVISPEPLFISAS